MLPSVFLSLEGADEKFVRKVHEFLPDGLAYFYPKSFVNGESLIEAMEDRVGKSTIFVLFASKKSTTSPWVGFEIDQARINKIKNKDFRILVFPTDQNVSISDLPSWMRAFWIPSAGLGHREIARYIRKVLLSGPLSQLPSAQIYGRGSLADKILSEMQESVLRTGASPNVLVIAGNAGIGRRTFSRKFLADAFPATPELDYGPQFPLPQFADLADFYRALRQEIETGFSLHTFAGDLAAFEALSLADQATEIARNIAHFGSLGQAVTIVTGNGIFEDRGFLKPWVPLLFRALKDSPTSKLIIISNRLLHENELRPHSNVFQMWTPALQDSDTRAIMIAAMSSIGAKPELPNGEVIRSIGGHPAIAKAAAALVSKRGPMVINNDHRDLFTIQEDVLSESLNFANLGEVDKDILSVLSWVPQLDGDMVRRIIVERHQIKNENLADSVSNLILSCLIEVSGASLQISNPVRALFRRLHGYGSIDLRKVFSEKLSEAWNESRENDEVRSELIDAIIYMTALEGGSLPAEFRGLLLPSTLQEVVRDTYDRGHDNPEAMNKVVNWGLPAISMKMDETAREEILSYVVRAQTRLGDVAGSEKTLKFFDDRMYRSRFYLRSFYLRHQHDDIEQAIVLLKKAREVRKYIGRVIADLAMCYQRLGRWKDLQDLVREEEQHVHRNAALLDVRIGMLIADNDYNAAEAAIRALSVMPRQGSRADVRRAMIMMKRDGNFKGAQELLTSIIQTSGGGHDRVRRLRAVAAASRNDVVTANADAEFLRARKRNYTAHDIEARIKLAQGDYDGAEEELNKVKRVTGPDQLLRARIYEMKAGDIRTPLAERDSLLKSAAELRSQSKQIDEFEIES